MANVTVYFYFRLFNTETNTVQESGASNENLKNFDFIDTSSLNLP